MAKSGFWRVSPSKVLVHSGRPADVQQVESGRIERLGVGQGLLVGDLNPSTGCGEIVWVGVIDSVSIPDQSISVVWRNSDFTLKPTPSGQVYWRKYDWFNFNPEVVDRYMLNAIFADIFDDVSWVKSRKRAPLVPREQSVEDVHSEVTVVDGVPDPTGELVGLPSVRASSNPTVGYVYLIWSQYGYKIGKAVNVKSRTKLFEVKLPFPIRVEHYARFSDYSRAEKALHVHFHEKRQEGEWFALNDADVAFIKSYGKPQPTGSL